MTAVPASHRFKAIRKGGFVLWRLFAQIGHLAKPGGNCVAKPGSSFVAKPGSNIVPWRPFRGGVSLLDGLQKPSGSSTHVYKPLCAGVLPPGLAEASIGVIEFTGDCAGDNLLL